MMFTRLTWVLAALVACAWANDTFVVLHSPENLVFKNEDTINQSVLKDLFSGALGFTAKTKPWNGLYFKNPLDVPDAAVVFAIEGNVDSLATVKGHKLNLIVDELEESTWQLLSTRLQNRVNNSNVVRISLGDGLDALGQSALGDLKPNSLDNLHLTALSLKNPTDQEFLAEMGLLGAIADRVPTFVKKDYKPHVYWFVISSLGPVFDVHGNQSAATNEALSIVAETLQNVSKAFRQEFHDNVLITAFTNKGSQHIIEKRQAEEAKNEETTTNKVEVNSSAPSGANEEETEEAKVFEKNNKEHEKINGTHTKDKNKDKIHENSNNTDISTQTVNIFSTTEEPNTTENYNKSIYNYNQTVEIDKNDLAPEYSEDFPVIFNIILWFVVVFFFSLLAICITIAEMDPGRDSIIYRMTSNRMKKDN